MTVLLAACGRIDFAPTIDASGDGPSVPLVDASEPGLVVWLRMEDDPTDGRIDDSIGGHHATCTSCGTSTPGRVGQALAFDATQQQFYELPSDATLETPNAFTVAFWTFIQNPDAQYDYLVAKRYSTIHDTWGAYIDGSTDDFYYESAFGSTATGNYEELTATVPTARWLHVALTWDNTHKRGYLDGVRVVEFAPPDVEFDSGEILLGCDLDNTNRYAFFTGALDEVRIYNRALSDAEILALAQ